MLCMLTFVQIIHQMCKKFGLSSKSDGKKGKNRVMTIWKENGIAEEKQDKEKSWQEMRNLKSEDEQSMKIVRKIQQVETISSNVVKVEEPNSNNNDKVESESWICGVCESDNENKDSECSICGMPKE